MSQSRTNSASLTHTGSDKLTKADIASEFSQIKERLTTSFKSDSDKLNALLATLDELASFELGRFLIKNKSLSGYWTWYVILGFKNTTITSPIEKYLLEKAPSILATQQRFAIFQSLLKRHIEANSVVCSIPCGMMADLLTLEIPGEIQDVRFVGIDLDTAVFDLAKDLGRQLNVRNHYEFFTKDAWELDIENEFDIVTSNGLNIYEKDDTKVVSLYKGIHRALKNNGRFICSALTPPPMISATSEWDMSQINKEDLATSAMIMKTILDVTWSNFRSSELTCDQLREAGFDNIEIHWDKQKMFPTFSAQKVARELTK